MKKRFFLSLLLLNGVIGWVPDSNMNHPQKTIPPKQLMLITSEEQRSKNKLRESSSNDYAARQQQIARIGDGYKTMASEFTTGSLFHEIKTTLIQNQGTYSISFSDDLSESELKTQMGMSVSGTIPIKEIVASPAFSYARKASKTKLNRTTTLIATQNLGTLKIQANPDQTFRVADGLAYYLDSTGNLFPESIGSFYKVYGDSVVVSKDLVGKIFITAKLSFDSVAISNTFNGSVGGSVASLFAGSEGKLIDINAKLKMIDDNTKRHTTLSIVATQFGGLPGNLLELFDSDATCSLDQLNTCLTIITKLNNYIKTDFRAQLDPRDYSTWYSENIVVAPYDTLNLATQSGVRVSLTNNINPLKNVALNALAVKVNRLINNEARSYDIASLMLESYDLSIEENDEAQNASMVTEQNYNNLKGFSGYCYSNLVECLQNSDQLVKSLINVYPTTFLDPRLGKIVGRVRSSYAPLMGEGERSSENFMKPQALLESGVYSSLYFKVKTLDNHLLTTTSINFNVACDIRWSFNHWGFDQNIVTSVYPGYSVLNNALHANFQSLCGRDESIYIRNPSGFMNQSLMIEMWGRD